MPSLLNCVKRKRTRNASGEVYIRKEGSDVILSPRPLDWNSCLTEGSVASESFMQEVEELPVQERGP